MTEALLSEHNEVETVTITGSVIEVVVPSGVRFITIRFLTSAGAASGGLLMFESAGTGWPILSGEVFQLEMNENVKKVWINGTSSDVAYIIWQKK